MGTADTGATGLMDGKGPTTGPTEADAMVMQAHPKHGDHQGHDHDHGHHDHSHHHPAHDPAHGPAQGHAAGDAGPPASPPPDSPAGTIYTCPLHPEVRQDHPAAAPSAA